MKKIWMYGECFEVRTKKVCLYEKDKIVRTLKSLLKDFCNCYTAPSTTKQRINEYWQHFAYSNFYGYFSQGANRELIDYGVNSYNSMIFTYDIIVNCFISDIILYFHITPTHNYLTIYKFV